MLQNPPLYSFRSALIIVAGVAIYCVIAATATLNYDAATRLMLQVWLMVLLIGLAVIAIATEGHALPGITLGALVGLLICVYPFLWILALTDLPTAAWYALLIDCHFAGLGGGIYALIKRYTSTGIVSVFLYSISFATSLLFEW